VVQGVREMFAGYRQGWVVQPVVRFDPQAARLGLERLAGEVSRPPVNASFALEGTRLVEKPGQLGYTINVEATIARLAENPQRYLEGAPLDLALMPVSPRVSDVSASMAEAQRLLDTPVQITAYDVLSDETLTLSASKEVVAGWLAVTPTEAGPVVTVDESKTAAYLESLNGTLGAGRALNPTELAGPLAAAVREGRTLAVTLRHGPTKYIVEPGDTLLKIGWKAGMPYWMILEANPGLDPENLWAGQELVIPSKDGLLPLPVVPGKRIIISISKQRMWVQENGERIQDFVISTGIDRCTYLKCFL
jgi:LysM repeat protein